MIKVVVFRCFAQGSKFGQIPLYSQISSGWQIWSKYIVVIHTFPHCSKVGQISVFPYFWSEWQILAEVTLGFFLL